MELCTRSVVRTITAASNPPDYQLPTKRRGPFGRAHPRRARFLRGYQGGRSGLRSQGRERVCPANASLRHDFQALPSLCLLRNPEPGGDRGSVSIATSSSAYINCSGFEACDAEEGGHFGRALDMGSSSKQADNIEEQMTIDERIEFPMQSIESHDRQIGELRERAWPTMPG